MASCLEEWNRRQKLLKERDRQKKQEAASTLHNFTTTGETGTQQLEFEKRLKELKIQDRSAKAETKDMLVFTSTAETTQQLEFQKRLKELKTQDRSAKAETKDMLSMFHGSYHGGDFDNLHTTTTTTTTPSSSARRMKMGNGMTMAKRKSSKIIELTQALHDSAGCLTYDDTEEPADESIKFLPTTPMQSPMGSPNKSVRSKKKFEDIFQNMISPFESPTNTPNSSGRRKKKITTIDSDKDVAAVAAAGGEGKSTHISTEPTEEKSNSVKLPSAPPIIQPSPTTTPKSTRETKHIDEDMAASSPMQGLSNIPKSMGEGDESDKMVPIPPVQNKELNVDIKPPTSIQSSTNTSKSTSDTDYAVTQSDDDQLPRTNHDDDSKDLDEHKPGRMSIVSSNGKSDNKTHQSQQRQDQEEQPNSTNFDSPPGSPKSGKRAVKFLGSVDQPKTPTKISPKGRKKLLAGLQKSPMMMSPHSPFYEDIVNDIQKNDETTSYEASRRNQIQTTKARKKQRRQLVELAFLFGLIYDVSTPKPGKEECTLAANAIVPDIVKKSASQLKIRCDPKKGRTANVTKIDDDDWFDQENQVRYVVRGKIQVYVFGNKNNNDGSTTTDLTDDEVSEQMKNTAQSIQKLLKRHCSYRPISPSEAENAINQDSVVESADALRRWIRVHNLF